MSRRTFLRTGAAALTLAAARPWAQGWAAPPHARKTLGPAQPFDYATLKGLARSLAGAAYKPPNENLPRAIEKLDWDHWEAIRFRDEQSLWARDGLRYQIRFAHLGFRVRRPVRMYVVEEGHAQELAFDPAMFDYSHAGVRPQDLPATMGFGGFKIFYHTDWVRDCAVFQGASYFRAVSGDLQYGMSHRGLAVDTGLPQPEEFPDFVAWYLERPAKDSDQLTVYGLLDSPSIAGAYRFVIQVGDTQLMDVDAALYPRKSIERLGIAPGTSMFFVGKNQRNVSEDWRPEIHDSDGLSIWSGSGEWIWRPLNNPRALRVNTFIEEAPRGFGLMQRERRFEQYQDDGVFYEKRPSVWVEPKASWGKGAIMLVEIPTRDETADNVVAFWNPADKPQRGQELLFGYRLYWCRHNPIANPLALARYTWAGIGGVIGQPRNHFSWRFVIDFFGGNLPLLVESDRVMPVISVSRGRIEIPSARILRPENGWRAMFDLAPDESTEPINLRLYLALNGQPLSETWLYQYTPPAPADRKTLLERV
jgi:periplasmic glucans biosynthesis protein